MTKFDPPPFSTPCGKKFRPPYLFSRPPTYKKSRPPTSILTIRTLRPTALDQHLHRHCFSMSLPYYSSNSHSTTHNSSSLATSISTWRIHLYRLHLNSTL